VRPIIVSRSQIATRQLLAGKIFLFRILLGLLVSSGCEAEEPLVFGQSAALSDPAAEPGWGVRRGILAGVERALSKRNLAPVATGSYMRNATAVKRALLEIRRGKPEAVIMIGAYKPAAAFIHWCHRLEMHPLFLNISLSARKRWRTSPGRGAEKVAVVPFLCERGDGLCL
jgi:hypothetical protein